MAGQTVLEKIAQAHMASGPKGRPVRTGDFLSIRPKHVMTHDNTSAVISKFKAIGATRVHDPAQPVFTLDHDIQNREEANLAKYRKIEQFAREHDIRFYPAGTGIGHQVMCERLHVVPGAFVVASDSHSNTYGALGAIGTPVVRTDAAAIWATGEFWWQVPPTVQVILEGELRDGATGKDLIITLCGHFNEGEVLNAAVEFGGPGVASLSIEERLTVANMSTEWGALVGWFPVDAKTIAYLEERATVLEKLQDRRVSKASLERWAREPPAPDADAQYAARITVDLSTITPHISGPDTVQVMTSLAELEAKKIAVQKAYLISCVNSRLGDLEAAAKVVKGKKVAGGVSFYIAAASKEVQEKAEASGAWGTLVEAGAHALPPGCGPCIGLGTGLLEPGEVGISATNRNFKGRMGAREAKCYLASPEVVAASALSGFITGPTPSTRSARLRATIEPSTLVDAPDETVEILDGFPSTLTGRLVFAPQNNLNTDGIYANHYTYRDDMTPEMMAKVVMENYDPEFAPKVNRGDLLVGGANFGTGSSREQAATSLQAKGIPLLIAATFSQTYVRNAFNNGLLCVECPSLVERLRALFADEVEAGTKTIIPGDMLSIDFASGVVSYRGERFRFPPLGAVPQSLVVDGGVENQVQKRLGLAR